MKPRLLDLFCGAGGAAMGYHRAGFDVVGVDINPQPNYPFEFIREDALTALDWLNGAHDWMKGERIVAIHASPPCQAYSTATSRTRRAHYREHADLVAPTRERLVKIGLPYVIENVVGAPLVDAVQLCGSSFGLDVRRHRLFESNVALSVPPCDHGWQTPRFRSLNSRRSKDKLAAVVGVHGHLNYPGEFELRCRAMGIDWMTNAELTQSIPPAYTEWLGVQLRFAVERARAASRASSQAVAA